MNNTGIPSHEIREYHSIKYIIRMMKKVIAKEIDLPKPEFAEDFNPEKLIYWQDRIKKLEEKYPEIEEKTKLWFKHKNKNQ